MKHAPVGICTAHDSGMSISDVARLGFAIRYRRNQTIEDFVWAKLKCGALGFAGQRIGATSILD